MLHIELHKTVDQQKAEIERMAKAEKEKDQLIAELQKKLQQNDGTNTFLLRSDQLVSTLVFVLIEWPAMCSWSLQEEV